MEGPRDGATSILDIRRWYISIDTRPFTPHRPFPNAGTNDLTHSRAIHGWRCPFHGPSRIHLAPAGKASPLAGGLLLLASTGALGADPPATGDWVVDDTTTLTNQDIVVTGDVIVRNGGSLTLTGGSLSLNMTAHGQHGILVENGGQLVLEGVKDVDSVGGAYRYNITLRGSAFIGNSTIRRMDGPTVPNPLSTPQGLVILSSSVHLYITTVRDSRGFAITVQPGSLADVTPVIESCTLRNNGGGIYCGGVLIATGDPVIKNCRFFSNTIGDVVALAANPTITGCVFGETILSPSVAAVVVMALAEPTISDCTFNWAASAIASVYANPIVRDCTVSNCYAGLTVIGNGPVVERLGISNTVAPVYRHWQRARS